MSNLQRWCKLWVTILYDSQFQKIRLEDVGAWTFLMALVCDQGERGKILISPPCPMILALFRCPDMDALMITLGRLPNVRLEHVNNDNGDLYVIIKNWFKYQIDPTASERVKRSRSKKRREEKLTSTSTSSALRAVAATPRATRENGNVTINEMESAEIREGNLEWKKTDTQNSLPESERMTLEEMRAIRLKNFGPLKSERGGKV